ncbi:MAG: hypothetical protein H0U76_21495 [Ktedonobacteraceae bacterium]|nr:hypothetical protein [Ktedonobacteraceae bacterium]
MLVTENDSTLYRLAGQPLLWVDADEGVALLKEAEQRGRTFPETLPLLEEASEYFNKGAFLQEDEGFWAAGRRAAVEQVRYRCRLWLAEAYTQHGMPGHAEMALSSLVEEDPFDEDALCRLMDLLHSQAMTHKALWFYEHACKVFTREGLEPTEATRALAVRLHEERHSLSLGCVDSVRIIPNRITLQPPTADGPASSILSSPSIQNELIVPESVRSLSETGMKQVRPPLFEERGDDQAVGDPSRRAILTHMVGMMNAVTVSLLDPGWWERLSAALTQPSAMNAQAFNHFERLIEECWSLCDCGCPSAAEQILSVLLPQMKQIAPYHVQASLLAAEGLRLQSVLSAHHLQLANKMEYCLQSVGYARLSGDPNTLAASLHELTAAFRYTGRQDAIFATFQEALSLSNQVTPLLRSGIYAGAAASFAQKGDKKEAESFMQRAYETFPDRMSDVPSFWLLAADNGHCHLVEYEGIMYLELHQPEKAESVLERFTCQSSENSGIPERNRLEMLNYQARALIQLGHLEKYAFCLEEGVAKAIAIQSKKRLSETLTIFQQELPRSWLNEPRLRQIAERFHFSMQGASCA